MQHNTFQYILYLIIIVILLTLWSGFFIVNEGFRAVVYTFGSLDQKNYGPGFHYKTPLITMMYQVQVSVQTDHVSKVICGTSSGVSVTFESIEVVNQLDKDFVYPIVRDYGVNYDKTLIYDKITHELNQFCSKHTLQEVYISKFDTLDEMLIEKLQESLNKYGKGILIRNVRISKPSVPPEVAKRYEEVVASQARKLTEITQGEEKMVKIDLENKEKQSRLKAENEQNLMLIEFDKLKQLAGINKEIEVNQLKIQKEKEYENGIQEITKIRSETEKIKKEFEIDVQHYANLKEIEYKNGLQTDAYVQIKIAESMNNNSKLYFGSLPQLPDIFGKIFKGLNK
jgi:regulator of protease activity HflC (stomatin/prohibitin superfamily)